MLERPMSTRLMILFAAAGALAVTTGARGQTAVADSLPALPSGQEWKLVWHDEFDGARLDTNKWDLCGDWKRRDGWWVKDDGFVD